jgi:hypothetical protein
MDMRHGIVQRGNNMYCKTVRAKCFEKRGRKRDEVSMIMGDVYVTVYL